MHIGFDAKRAFLNSSGLGNYARTLIRALASNFPKNQYLLFTTKTSNTDFSSFTNISAIQPEKFVDKKLPSRWRSYGITELLAKNNLDVYHGLSNELPFNIGTFKGKKIVTIHDLIFLRYPKLYPLIDRKIYNKKCKTACELADVIVATSAQTQHDIIEFHSVDPEKIKVVYQSCNEIFYKTLGEQEISKVRSKYDLPEKYLLYVGNIEERKNLLLIIKALTQIKGIPLVVIGKKKAYFKKVQQCIVSNKLENRVLFRENVPNEAMPALYNSAAIFIYPSLFEGFGIPIIEALTCRTPVITTQGGCFAEAGGKNSVYIDPTSHEQLAGEIKKLLGSSELRKNVTAKGFEHSRKFLPDVIASEMMHIYSGK